MTPPRRIIAGQLCFITARTVGRTFRLLPERRVVEIVRYVFALAVQRYRISVHEFLFMSNHFHVLATDVDGCLPDFMNYLDSLLARTLNALHGHSGTVFEKHYNLVSVADGEAALRHAVYILANPCAAHLVRRSKQWKGFSSRSLQYDRTMVFRRPTFGLWRNANLDSQRDEKLSYAKQTDDEFQPATGANRLRSKPSRLPESVEFTLERPPMLASQGPDDVRLEVLRRLDARELELIAERSRRGAAVMGMRRVLEQKWWSFPTMTETLFTLIPRVSAGSKWNRVEALTRIKSFVAAYRAARALFACGMRDTSWPCGTWLMRVRHGLPCEQAPPL